ncbi:hypothetical protein ACFQ5D_24660, partial [Paenibacillus farraposensis]
MQRKVRDLFLSVSDFFFVDCSDVKIGVIGVDQCREFYDNFYEFKWCVTGMCNMRVGSGQKW